MVSTATGASTARQAFPRYEKRTLLKTVRINRPSKMEKRGQTSDFFNEYENYWNEAAIVNS
jgi:hypothetical protein